MNLQLHFSDDGGRDIDWGRASSDYAEHRPDFPTEFYDRLSTHGIGRAGQRILDLGTGVGFLAQNFAQRGALVTGIDIAAGQLEVARERAAAAGLDVDYRVAPAEATGLPTEEYDAVTAGQCWLYFRQPETSVEVHRVLKRGGLLAIGHFCWLPGESELAQQAEELVLKYNPAWTGARLTSDVPTEMPECFAGLFEQIGLFVYDVPVPFTRDSWRGRWRACRGVGATLSPDEIIAFDREHAALLDRMVGDRFTVLHRVDARILRRL